MTEFRLYASQTVMEYADKGPPRATSVRWGVSLVPLTYVGGTIPWRPWAVWTLYGQVMHL